MHVLAISIELHLPSCRSLKDRRAVLKPIIEGGRQRFGVSAAEVGFQDKWQRAQVAFALVASSAAQATEIIDNVERFVWSFPEVEVTSSERHWLEVD